MPRAKGKLPLHQWFLQVAVQEEVKQAPVKLNREASRKIMKLRLGLKRGVSIDSTNKNNAAKTGG